MAPEAITGLNGAATMTTSICRTVLVLVLSLALLSPPGNVRLAAGQRREQQRQLPPGVRGERVISGSEVKSQFRSRVTDETNLTAVSADQLVLPVIKIDIESDEQSHSYEARETFGPAPWPSTARTRPFTSRPRSTLTTRRPVVTMAPVTPPVAGQWMVFDGRKWIMYDLEKLPDSYKLRSNRETFNIYFETNHADGLIWFTGNDRDNMHLVMKDGHLYLVVVHNGQEDERIDFRSRNRLDDGVAHNVTLIRNGRRILVDIDGEQTVKYLGHDSYLVDSESTVYLGGSEDTYDITRSRVRSNFHGTIQQAVMTGDNLPDDLDLLEMALIKPSPIHVVINGRRDKEKGYPKMTTRRTTSRPVDQDQTRVTFTSGHSFIRLPHWNASREGTVELYFRTVQPDGLMLISSPKPHHKDYFAIELVDGIVYVIYNLGTRAHRFQLGSNVNDGQVHYLKVERNGRTVWLTLDNEQQHEVLDTSGDGTLDLGPDMYIGGSAYPGSLPWDVMSRRADFFRGCIWGATFNNGAVMELNKLRRDQRMPGVETGCSTMPTECSRTTCQHGECKEQWNGPVCDCSRTMYSGERCEKEAPLIAFRGSDFVRIQVSPTAVTHTNDITVHFRTSKEDGVLFATSKHGSSDYLKASLNRGQIKLETFIESVGRVVPLSVACDQPLNDNQWHTLYIKRRAGVIEAYVDNCRPAGVQIPGEDFTLDVDQIFIGKSDPNEAPRTTFVGNMRNFYFDGQKLFDRFQSDQLVDASTTRAPAVVFPTITPTDDSDHDDDEEILTPMHPVTFPAGHTIYVRVSPVQISPSTRVRLMFRTTDKNGLILYHTGNSFFAVELVDGKLQVIADDGSGPRFASSTSPSLADGMWHELDISRSTVDRFVIHVDGEELATRLSYRSRPEISSAQPLYVGGVPESMLGNLPSAITSRRGFTGCISSLIVNGRHLDLQQIEPLLTPGCTDVNPVSYCHDHLCQHRGICLESINTYICDCNLTSFAGSHCEDEAEGYLFSEHLKPGIVIYTLTTPQYTTSDKVAFGFMTWQQNGTIMRIDSGIRDFIEAKLENGYLVFHYDLGDSYQKITETRRRLNDGQYHYATFVRHGPNVTIHVDSFPVRMKTHDLAATTFNNLAAVKVGGNINRENQIVDHFDGIIAGVYVNGYRVIDMSVYDHNSHITVEGDATVATHPFTLPIRIPPRVTQMPGEVIVVPQPGEGESPEGPGGIPLGPGKEPGEVIPGPGPENPVPGGEEEAGGGFVGGGLGGGEPGGLPPEEAPLVGAAVLTSGSGADAAGTRAAAVAGAMLGILAAVSSIIWALYKFKPGLISLGGGAAKPMVISSPQTPLLAAQSGNGAASATAASASGVSGGGGGAGGGGTMVRFAGGSAGSGSGAGSAGGVVGASSSSSSRSVAVAASGGASGASGANGSAVGAYQRGYGVIESQQVITMSSSSSGAASGAGGSAASGAGSSGFAAGGTGTMHRGIQTDLTDGTVSQVGGGVAGGQGSSTVIQSTVVKNVYTSQQIGGAGYGTASYGTGYGESGSSGFAAGSSGYGAGSPEFAVGSGAGYGTAEYSSAFDSASAQSAGFGTLQTQPPLSSDAMLTASSFTYERGVNVLQADGYIPSSYNGTLSAGSVGAGSFQMRNLPLNMAAFTGAQQQSSVPNIMTAVEQIRVDCAQLTTNGRYVVTGSIYGPPQVWDLKTGELIKMMVGEELSSTDLHLANGDTLLVGQVADVQQVNDIATLNRPHHRKLQIWDFDSGRPLEMRKNESCTASCMMSDGERMVLARTEQYGGAAVVVIWDVLGNEPLRHLKYEAPVAFTDHISYVGVSRDSRYIVAGYQNSVDGQASFIIFDLSEHDMMGPKVMSLAAPVEVTAMLDNHEAVTGTFAGELVIWSLRTGKPLRHLVSVSTRGGATVAHKREVKELAVSKDVSLLVSASADSTLGVWNLETDKLSVQLSGHRDEVWCCALSNDNELVVSGSRDQTIRMWRVSDGVAVAAIDTGVDIFKVLISNNAKTVVALADKFSARKLIMLQVVRTKTRSSSSCRSPLPVA